MLKSELEAKLEEVTLENYALTAENETLKHEVEEQRAKKIMYKKSVANLCWRLDDYARKERGNIQCRIELTADDRYKVILWDCGGDTSGRAEGYKIGEIKQTWQKRKAAANYIAKKLYRKVLN